jgi:hypothetical protein
MIHKKIILITFLLLAVRLTGLDAQETVPVTGGNATGSGGTANYTVGQIVYTTNSGTNGTSFQGVQQPFEISVVTGIEEAENISLEFAVYPNPATDFIILKTGTYDAVNLRFQLYDNNGGILLDKKVEETETTITMSNLVPSIYFLKVSDKKEVVRTFKIIKK